MNLIAAVFLLVALAIALVLGFFKNHAISKGNLGWSTNDSDWFLGDAGYLSIK